MAKEIDRVPDGIDQLLKEAGGSYVEAYHLLVQRREEAAVSVQRSTAAIRLAEKRSAIKDLDQDRLKELQRKMADAVDTITRNETELSPGLLLSDYEKFCLMQEFLDQRDITDLLDARKAMLRELVFDHLTAQFEAQGVEDPDNQNGEVQVPELGYRFVRERCGRKDAVLHEDKLKGLLGEQWEAVCEIEEIPAQYIPAHKNYVLKEEKVLELAQKDPTVLSKLLDSLEVGGWRTPTFTVKPLKER